MKIFWSWQSDTPGDTGRFFVRDCLKDAIAKINQPEDVAEPPERTRDPLTLDHDRAGVAGHRNLGDTILAKIAAADVFVGDVTLVAELKVPVTPDNPEGVKKLINSNVAIEYGYAVGTCTDDATLLVMNLHYGSLTKLPFDLAYKIAPCRYELAPDASKDEIAVAKKSLTALFVGALKLHLDRITPPPPPVIPFQRNPNTSSSAVYWQPEDILGSIGQPHPFRPNQDSVVQYRFAPEHAFYLRLMPSASIPEFDVTRVMDVVDRARLDALTAQHGHKIANQNPYGAVAIVPTGSTKDVLALSQIFQNGEIWGVTREFVVRHENDLVVPMIALFRALRRGLKSFVEVAHDELGIELPFDVEIGAVGLKGVRLSVPPPPRPFAQLTGQIFGNQLVVPSRLLSITPKAQDDVVQEFLRRLYDLGNCRYVPGAIS